MNKTKKMVLLGLLISQALVLSVIESWFPIPIGPPGVKLGLANIITLLVIVFFGFKSAMFVVVIRCILLAIFSGSPITFLFSLSGGVLSTLAMSGLYKKFSSTFSLVGISIIGALMHNLGQIIVGMIILREVFLIFYFPVLIISGVITGLLIGIFSKTLIKSLIKSGVFKELDIKNFIE